MLRVLCIEPLHRFFWDSLSTFYIQVRWIAAKSMLFRNKHMDGQTPRITLPVLVEVIKHQYSFHLSCFSSTIWVHKSQRYHSAFVFFRWTSKFVVCSCWFEVSFVSSMLIMIFKSLSKSSNRFDQFFLIELGIFDSENYQFVDVDSKKTLFGIISFKLKILHRGEIDLFITYNSHSANNFICFTDNDFAKHI